MTTANGYLAYNEPYYGDGPFGSYPYGYAIGRGHGRSVTGYHYPPVLVLHDAPSGVATAGKSDQGGGYTPTEHAAPSVGSRGASPKPDSAPPSTKGAPISIPGSASVGRTATTRPK